ncbi:MAG: amidohydrolase family protein [Candidatus Heimdallarchaeaceae archaeon]
MPDKIIEADFLLTCNSKNEIIKDAALYVVNDTIQAVGTKKEIFANYSSSNIIGGTNKIVLPGLINTHSHSVQSFLRGLADDFALLDWLQKAVLPGEAGFTPEEVYYSSLLGFAEMIQTGTTTANDMLTTHDSEKGIQAAKDIGIRTRIGKMLMDLNEGFPDSMIQETEQIINDVTNQIELYHNSENERIKYSLNARFLLSCSPKLMKAIVDIHNKYSDIMIHTHASESKEECKEVEKIYGKSYVRALNEVGALGKGTIIAHGIWLDEEEFDIIRKTGTKISHNPSSNSKLASGICDVSKYVNLGITVGLATDGAPCNNNYDMFREMRLASFLQKVKHLNEQALPAKKVIRMATIEGARAINLDNKIGSLEVGKKADLIQVDLDKINAMPLYNPTSHLVYSASSNDVTLTMVDGRILYENGEFKTLNLSRLKDKVRQYQRKWNE